MRHIPHVLVAGPWAETVLALDESRVHHLTRVLRLGDGATITYTDGAGRRGEGVLTGSTIARGEERSVERRRALTVAVAPPDSKDRARFLVEKLAELGVARLLWLRTTHGQGRPPRADRVAAWTVAALEQSRGAWLMEVGDGLVGFAELTRPVFVATPGGEEPGGVSGDLTVAIGPEGGWAPDEPSPGAIPLDLGPTILRVETAAIVAAALLMNAGR